MNRRKGKEPMTFEAEPTMEDVGNVPRTGPDAIDELISNMGILCRIIGMKMKILKMM